MVSYNLILKCHNFQVLGDKQCFILLCWNSFFFFETKFLCVALELVTFPPVPPKMCMTGLNTLFLTY